MLYARLFILFIIDYYLFSLLHLLYWLIAISFDYADAAELILLIFSLSRYFHAKHFSLS